PRRLSNGDGELTALRHRLSRVADQIQESLPEERLVDVHLGQAVIGVDAAGYACSLELGSHEGHELARQVLRTLPLEPRRRSSSDAEILLGDPRQAFHLGFDGGNELRLLLFRAPARVELLLEELDVESDG